MTKSQTSARLTALGIGFACAALGAVGAYQLQAALDGPGSYLALAAPVVALAAALIPWLGEQAWASKQKFKAVLLWLAVVPAAAVVFYGAAERVHASKALNEAGRQAVHFAVSRAEVELTEARAAAAAAVLAANRVRGLTARQCNSRCLSIRATETSAQERLEKAENALRQAQGQATAASPLAAPVWLLPAALDLIAFTAIWVGLAVGHEKKVRKVARRKKSRKPKPVTPVLKLAA